MQLKMIVSVLVLTSMSSALVAGSLEPTDPPAPTFKTLTEVEPRTALTPPANRTTLVISDPGSYYLTEDVDVLALIGIQIIANHVTLDLNGFSVTGTSELDTVTGIAVAANTHNVRILNGTVFDVSGNGIISLINSSQVTIENVHVRNIGFNGLDIKGVNNRIRDVSVNITQNADGIFCTSCLVESVNVTNAADSGITIGEGSSVINAHVSGNGSSVTHWGVDCPSGGLVINTSGNNNGDGGTNHFDPACITVGSIGF